MALQTLATEVAILVVDDDEVDAMGIERALKSRGVTAPILRARDGVEGLAVLQEQDRLKRPCLILLDINMPRMNGFEMLDAMHQENKFPNTVVFMLTTSRIPNDRLAACAREVAGFIVKNDVGDEFASVIQMLNQLRGAELPIAP